MATIRDMLPCSEHVQSTTMPVMQTQFRNGRALHTMSPPQLTTIMGWSNQHTTKLSPYSTNWNEQNGIT